MDEEEKLVELMIAELQRQSAESGGRLKVEADGEGGVALQGRVNLEALAMVAVGALAGGP